MGVELPWWVVSLTLWVVVWFLGFIGIDTGARFMGACLVLELVIIAAAAGSTLWTLART